MDKWLLIVEDIILSVFLVDKTAPFSLQKISCTSLFLNVATFEKFSRFENSW